MPNDPLSVAEPKLQDIDTPEDDVAGEVSSAAPEVPLPPPIRADSSLAAAMEAFDEYMVRKGFSENTIKAFRNDLKIFAGFMGAETRLLHISTQNLEDYLEWMQGERGAPCSAKTLARRITSLKVFFGWLHGIGVLGTDPAEPVAQQPARPPLPKIFTDMDVKALLRTAQDYALDRKKPDARPYLLISLLLQTGIKKAECARLAITDLDTSNPNYPELHVRYQDEAQAHKNRSIRLDRSIVRLLDQYLEQYRPGQFLFECTPRNLEYILDEVGQKAKIRTTQVGFETLRWTCAVFDYRRGMPEEQLRQKMGLSKISWRDTVERIHQLSGRNRL